MIADDLHENLNESLNKKYEFRSTKKSLYLIHFPQNLNQLDEVKEKIIYEEFSLVNSNLIYQRIIEKLIIEGFIFLKLEIYSIIFTTIILILSLLLLKKSFKEIKIDFSSKHK